MHLSCLENNNNDNLILFFIYNIFKSEKVQSAAKPKPVRRISEKKNSRLRLLYGIHGIGSSY